MARKKREPEPPRLVAVEGPLGVGKTAFVERWAARTGAQPVGVDVEENPFLGEIFSDPERRAFSAQMCFLLARHKVQGGLRQGDLFARSTVVDFVLERDRHYAELLLGEAELSLYERIFRLLQAQAVAPDLLVALHARPGWLLERLRARDLPHERPVTPELLERIVAGHAALVNDWTASPVVRIDVDGVDLSEDERTLDRLVDEVRRMSSDLAPGDRIELSGR